jgi:type IV fimbrial biogenesis protein FimT
MYYCNRKPGRAPQNGSPFIGLLMPFVCVKSTIILPSIGRKIPLVCNKGFSLIELIVALTIAGVLMAIAAPALQKFVSSNRLTSQVNDLMADINLARSEAIKRAVDTGVCVTAAGGSTCVTAGNWSNGWLTYACPATDPTCTGATRVVVKIHEALTGKNTLTSPGSVDTIIFAGSGLLRSPAAGTRQFTLTDTNTSGNRILCLSATGRPSLSGTNCP